MTQELTFSHLYSQCTILNYYNRDFLSWKKPKPGPFGSFWTEFDDPFSEPLNKFRRGPSLAPWDRTRWPFPERKESSHNFTRNITFTKIKYFTFSNFLLRFSIGFDEGFATAVASKVPHFAGTTFASCTLILYAVSSHFDFPGWMGCGKSHSRRYVFPSTKMSTVSRVSSK